MQYISDKEELYVIRKRKLQHNKRRDRKESSRYKRFSVAKSKSANSESKKSCKHA